mmetsp:Transcript_71247/g.208842  ORF Transcript_71247/g.208842 Transcript_71247/m.208842 type:complete len:251 (-) Transcript_71247:786-1538(-)
MASSTSQGRGTPSGGVQFSTRRTASAACIASSVANSCAPASRSCVRHWPSPRQSRHGGRKPRGPSPPPSAATALSERSPKPEMRSAASPPRLRRPRRSLRGSSSGATRMSSTSTRRTSRVSAVGTPSMAVRPLGSNIPRMCRTNAALRSRSKPGNSSAAASAREHRVERIASTAESACSISTKTRARSAPRIGTVAEPSKVTNEAGFESMPTKRGHPFKVKRQSARWYAGSPIMLASACALSSSLSLCGP